MRIAVACGGTGGHVLPGLATACLLKEQGHDVTLWLAGREIENTSIREWQGSVVRTGIKSFSGKLCTGFFVGMSSWLAALPRSRRLLKKSGAEVLLAMGSYASVAPVLAAWSLGIPVVLHEANAVPGRAVSFLSRFAAIICTAFPPSAGDFGDAKVARTGLPLRRQVKERFDGSLLDPGVFTVLVMGGSQGAHRLNEVVTSALCELHSRGIKVQVVHLAGAKDEIAVRNAYSKAGMKALVFGFLSEMGKAYGSVDVAISRSGAGACMELAIHRIPALLVPYPYARRNHQMMNARVMEAAGGASVLPESKLTGKAIADFVEAHIGDPQIGVSMRAGLERVAVHDAVDRLAQIVVSAAGSR